MQEAEGGGSRAQQRRQRDGLEARLDRSKKVRTPPAGRVEAERGAARLGRAEGLHRHNGTAAVEEEDATVRHEVELG